MDPRRLLLRGARRLPRWVRAPAGRLVRASPRLWRLIQSQLYGAAGPAFPAMTEDAARELFREQQDQISADEARRRAEDFARRPLVSVLMPVYRTPPQWLRRAVESLQDQYYANWELCAVDDCSPDDAQRTLLAEMAANDPRIRLEFLQVNRGIAGASNAALAMARGDYVALLDHDDELTPDALFRVVEAINAHPGADFFYSDECKVDDTPKRRLFDFILKPDWSPEIMFNGMLTGHLTVYARELVEALGGFRSAYDVSQDYDLALRAAEQARQIVHIERILYLGRAIRGSAAAGGKDHARETNIAALQDALDRRGIKGQAIALPHANCVRLDPPPIPRRVSIVIPSDSLENLRAALAAIRDMTGYPDYEVLAVCNSGVATRIEAEFADYAPLRCVRYDLPYNFSDKCNDGARAATGDVVIFYNDDVFPLHMDWIERLTEYLALPGVGGVSPKLLYPDDTIQYAGMIVGTPGLCGTPYHRVPKDGADPFLSMHRYVRNVSMLSGACCAFRREVFLDLGGFDAANTRDAHSDMDLSFRVMEAGMRCVYTPYAVLRHIGNHSWGNEPARNKADIFCLQRWGRQLERDPYFTPSMQRVLYQDFRFAYRIHAPPGGPREPMAGPNVLLVSHELSLTGAPRMLLYAARALRAAGIFPVVVAPADGPMREEFLREGVVVIVDASLREGHVLFERFARNFDLAIVNTAVLPEVVRQLSAIPILPIIWWLHESEMLADLAKTARRVSRSRIRLLCVSDYARSFLPEGLEADLLRYGIPDDRQGSVSTPGAAGPLTFVCSGTIEPRKGQDLLVDAVAMLPPAIRRDCRFVIAGKLWDSCRPFWEPIADRMQALPEITYAGDLGHQRNLDLIASADVLLCASRDESVSLVVMEAAMFGRPAILSDHVGAAEYLDAESYFLFRAGDAAGLAAQIAAAHAGRADLARKGQLARRAFEERMSFHVFADRLLTLVGEEIARTPDAAAARRDAA